jgi:hypothetical protein
MTPILSYLRSGWRVPNAWKVLVAFALGCLVSYLVSWQATRLSLLKQHEWMENSLQRSFTKEQKLRATVARLILTGEGASWAERQLRELPFIVMDIHENWPDNAIKASMLCEFRAMYSATGTGRELKPWLEEIEAKGICKNYRLAPF